MLTPADPTSSTTQAAAAEPATLVVPPAASTTVPVLPKELAFVPLASHERAPSAPRGSRASSGTSIKPPPPQTPQKLPDERLVLLSPIGDGQPTTAELRLNIPPPPQRQRTPLGQPQHGDGVKISSVPQTPRSRANSGTKKSAPPSPLVTPAAPLPLPSAEQPHQPSAQTARKSVPASPAILAEAPLPLPSAEQPHQPSAQTARKSVPASPASFTNNGAMQQHAWRPSTANERADEVTPRRLPDPVDVFVSPIGPADSGVDDYRPAPITDAVNTPKGPGSNKPRFLSTDKLNRPASLRGTIDTTLPRPASRYGDVARTAQTGTIVNGSMLGNSQGRFIDFGSLNVANAKSFVFDSPRNGSPDILPKPMPTVRVPPILEATSVMAGSDMHRGVRERGTKASNSAVTTEAELGHADRRRPPRPKSPSASLRKSTAVVPEPRGAHTRFISAFEADMSATDHESAAPKANVQKSLTRAAAKRLHDQTVYETGIRPRPGGYGHSVMDQSNTSATWSAHPSRYDPSRFEAPRDEGRYRYEEPQYYPSDSPEASPARTAHPDGIYAYEERLQRMMGGGWRDEEDAVVDAVPPIPYYKDEAPSADSDYEPFVPPSRYRPPQHKPVDQPRRSLGIPPSSRTVEIGGTPPVSRTERQHVVVAEESYSHRLQAPRHPAGRQGGTFLSPSLQEERSLPPPQQQRQPSPPQFTQVRAASPPPPAPHFSPNRHVQRAIQETSHIVPPSSFPPHYVDPMLIIRSATMENNNTMSPSLGVRSRYPEDGPQTRGGSPGVRRPTRGGGSSNAVEMLRRIYTDKVRAESSRSPVRDLYDDERDDFSGAHPSSYRPASSSAPKAFLTPPATRVHVDQITGRPVVRSYSGSTAPSSRSASPSGFIVPRYPAPPMR